MEPTDVYATTFDETVAFESTTNACPECRGPIAASGIETVCEDCGLVLGTDELDRGPEWHASQRSERKRTGAPLSEGRHDRGLSSEIGYRVDANGRTLSGRKRRQLGRLRREHARAKCRSKADRSLMHGLSEVRRICGALGFGLSVREEACALFRRAQSENLLRGRCIEGMAAGSVYAVVRCSGVIRTLEEIVDVAAASTDRVRGSYRVLNVELGLPARPVTPSAYVPRLASELDVSDEVRGRACELAVTAEATGVTNGLRPSGFAAACLYKAGKTTRAVTQVEVAEAANSTPTTLRANVERLDALSST